MLRVVTNELIKSKEAFNRRGLRFCSPVLKRCWGSSKHHLKDINWELPRVKMSCSASLVLPREGCKLGIASFQYTTVSCNWYISNTRMGGGNWYLQWLQESHHYSHWAHLQGQVWPASDSSCYLKTHPKEPSATARGGQSKGTMHVQLPAGMAHIKKGKYFTWCFLPYTAV